VTPRGRRETEGIYFSPVSRVTLEEGDKSLQRILLRLGAGLAVGAGLGLLALGLPWFLWPDEGPRFVGSDDLVISAAALFAVVCGVGLALQPLRHWWQLWTLLVAGAVAGVGLGAELAARLEPGGLEVLGISEGVVMVAIYLATGTLLGFVAFLLSVQPEGPEDLPEAAPEAPEAETIEIPEAATVEVNPAVTREGLGAEATTLIGAAGSDPPHGEPDHEGDMSQAPHSLPVIDELDVEGQRVLVRCDLNVPLEDGRIADDMRIRASIPTLDALLKRGARLAVCSHLGRPKGKIVDDLRLAPVGERLSQLLAMQVEILDEIVGMNAAEACASDSKVVLLENLRFDPREETNDPEFAAALAALADAYVNDAFGSSHRAHASVVGVTELLPSAAGLLLAEEITRLGRLLEDPKRPFVAVLGGAKVSDKLGVIANLLERVDAILIGGAMAFTLLKAAGSEVGRSLVEDDRIEEVEVVLAKSEEAGVDIRLPVDVVAADEPEEGASHDTVELDDIGDRMGVDIGPATAATFADVISGARTVLWNGPMGIFEIKEFSEGTRAVARAVASATANGAYTVVGGGDSAAALKELNMTEAVSHLSTGGGASLEFLEGKDLPGIAALKAKTKGRQG
jgi:phosphoglycerate kinase